MSKDQEQAFKFTDDIENLSQVESDYLEQLKTMENLTRADYEAFSKVGKGQFPQINAWAKDRLTPDVVPNITGIPKGKEVEEGGIYQRREEFNLKLEALKTAGAESEEGSPVSPVSPVSEVLVEPVEDKSNKTLTLEDVTNSFTLQSLGVEPGDRIEDGALVRVHSSDKDEIKIDKVLTTDDIFKSATLRELGAEDGDLIIINDQGEKKFLSRGENDQLRQGLFAFTKSANYLENASLFLEALFPVPEYAKGYTTTYGYSPDRSANQRTFEEEFGEDISKLPFDERRKVFLRKRERKVLRAAGPMFSYDPESTGAAVGAISKAVIDPINLLPAATTAKGALGLGALIAGVGSVADDRMTTESGEVDMTKALVSAAAGGLLSGGFVKGADVLLDRGAKKIVRRAQIEVDKALKKGANPTEAKEMLIEAGVDLNKLKAAQQRTGIKINVSPAKAAQKQVEEIVVNDSALGRLSNSAVDKVLGSISTRIKALDEATFGRLRRFEYDTHKNTSIALDDSKNWALGFSNLGVDVKNSIARHLYNGEFNAARGLMGRGLADEFDMSVLPVLRKMGDDLKESGHSFDKIENYFPRIVKDLKGLQESLGVEESGLINASLRRYASSKGTKLDNLTSEEKAQVIDQLVQGRSFFLKDGKPGFVKTRKLVLTDDTLKYYASPEESLVVYLRRAVNDIEKRKFMGRHGVIDPDTGLLNADKSVGAYVEKAVDEGRIRPKDEADMLAMLRSRFVGGEQSPHAVNATVRDLGYMGTIANPVSAITQLGDIGTSGALNGFRNTMSSLFKEKNVELLDIYIDDVSKELSQASLSGTAKMLEKVMKGSGFKALDRLGKETYINAAFKNAKKMVKSEKGLAKFKKKIGSTYGDETEALIKDLESGNLTDTVKYFLFNELADVQPIALSEFPQKYLEKPNTRILYMLKAFTMKQIDVFRRNVVQEYAKGNKKEAVKNATLLAAYLSTANTGTQYAKDMILGRDVTPDDIPDRAMWNLLSVYGLTRYTNDRYISRGDWKGAVFNTLVPATPLIDSLLSLGNEALFEEDPDVAKLVKPVPIVGNLTYNWFLGGAEEYNEKQFKKNQ